MDVVETGGIESKWSVHQILQLGGIGIYLRAGGDAGADVRFDSSSERSVTVSRMLIMGASLWRKRRASFNSSVNDCAACMYYYSLDCYTDRHPI